MASARTVPSRLITAAVWGSGALIGVILVQILTGWGEAQARDRAAAVPDYWYVAAIGFMVAGLTR